MRSGNCEKRSERMTELLPGMLLRSFKWIRQLSIKIEGVLQGVQASFGQGKKNEMKTNSNDSNMKSN